MNGEIRRKTPDELLREIQDEESPRAGGGGVREFGIQLRENRMRSGSRWPGLVVG